MFSFSALIRGIVWMSLAVFWVNGYAGGPDGLLVRPSGVDIDIQYQRPFFDDTEDRRILSQTRGVFHGVANRVVLGECQNVQRQGNALGLLLQMVVNNWTYNDLLGTARAAFTRIFCYGNPWEGALHRLMDSIEEEYTDGVSHADWLMRWILEEMCRYGTPVPYHNVRLRAYNLLERTHRVPLGFVSVFDAPNENEEPGRLYRVQLARITQGIQERIEGLQNGAYVEAGEQLDALNAIFYLAVETPDVREDMSLIELVTTGYDRLFQYVPFHEEALLDFVDGLLDVDKAADTAQNLVRCILVLLCEKGTQVSSHSVRLKAYQGLKHLEAVPPGFVTADLGK